MPIGLRLLAILLRTVFFGALIAITVRLSSPQSETIWNVYETPGDLIRLALGCRPSTLVGQNELIA